MSSDVAPVAQHVAHVRYLAGGKDVPGNALFDEKGFLHRGPQGMTRVAVQAQHALFFVNQMHGSRKGGRDDREGRFDDFLKDGIQVLGRTDRVTEAHHVFLL